MIPHQYDFDSGQLFFYPVDDFPEFYDDVIGGTLKVHYSSVLLITLLLITHLLLCTLTILGVQMNLTNPLITIYPMGLHQLMLLETMMHQHSKLR